MNGTDFDYDFGNKRQWRRWLWNRICERLTVKPRDAVVLYLAGVHYYDRAVALRHGFRDENLIAIDRCGKVVSELRANKVLAIQSDFTDALVAWPDSMPVHVVLGDFCSGITLKFFRIALLLEVSIATHGAVFAFNFMRGRDEEWCKLAGKYRSRMPIDRGIQFLVMLDSIRVGRIALQQNFIRERLPDFNSYASISGQVFDSVVYRSTTRNLTPVLVGHKDTPKLVLAKKGQTSEKLKKSITAIRAHRTRRLEAVQ